MITSMTGYGKGIAENGKLTVEVDVKSVNNRFLDLSLKIPQILQSKEYELREIVRNKLNRGKVTLLVQLKFNNNDDDLGNFDESKFNNLMDMLNKIKKTSKIKETIKLQHLIELKDYFLLNSSSLDDNDFDVVKSAIVSALDAMLEMKKKEGNELGKDILKRIKNIEEKTAFIKQEAISSVKEDFEKLIEKVKALTENVYLNSERLETEAALLAEKADITEECVRLESHIKFFEETLLKENEPGRKLNFLCQELHRESNTISSKTVSINIIHTAVLIKEEVEKIREQIQNIE